MASCFGCPWGDGHFAVVDALTWIDNSRLKCVSRAFHDATLHSTTVNAQVWWGQAQSTEQVIEGLVPSLVRQRKVLTPQTRPNLAMLMIDRDILLTTTVRDLCGRLHSAHLVPLECPIMVVESENGVFGAGVTGEGDFSTYEDRDIELDPPAPVRVVLTVAYIPPEERSDGGAPEPRVRCFVAEDLPENRRYGFRQPVGVQAVLMACAPSVGSVKIGRGPSSPALGGPSVSNTEAVLPSGVRPSVASDKNEQAYVAFGPNADPPDIKSGERTGMIDEAHSKGSQQPLRRSTRTSTVARSKAAVQRAPPPKLTSPSSKVPLDDADTVFLVGDQPWLLRRTGDWLIKLLGEDAVILGGVCSSALVVGDQVFDEARQTSQQGMPTPLLVGVALRGVHAMVVSAKGFECVGPTFRVDSVFDTQSSQDHPTGDHVRQVTVVEGGAVVRTTNAMSILLETPQDPAWGNHDFDFSEMFLGVGNSPTELLPSRSARRGQGQGQESEEAKGRSPLHVTEMYAESVGVMGSVTVGQYAQFVCTTTQQALADAELAYQSCKRRIEREGSVVLSSIHFTCSVRPDRVELTEQQQQQHGEGGDGNAMVTRVTTLHQQEMVRFIKTLKAPAAGMFCQGELGPWALLVGGIFPKTATSSLQGDTSCSAVLSWNPGPIGTKPRARSVSQR